MGPDDDGAQCATLDRDTTSWRGIGGFRRIEHHTWQDRTWLSLVCSVLKLRDFQSAQCQFSPDSAWAATSEAEGSSLLQGQSMSETRSKRLLSV